MALKFLNKKGWHTGSLRNIENVWKAEQKHEAEQRKLEELRKQIHEERERAEFRQLQEQAGLISGQERLEFLYDSGLAVGKSSGFKALESVPKPEPGATASSSPSEKEPAALGALFEEKPQSANDAWRKLTFDPLLSIRRSEQESLARIKKNPIQMDMIRKSVEATKNKDKDEKKRRKKHHKKKSERKTNLSSDSDSEDASLTVEKHRESHHKGSRSEKHSSKRTHTSDDELSEGDNRRKKYHDEYEDRRPSGSPNRKSDASLTVEKHRESRHNGSKSEKHSSKRTHNPDDDLSEGDSRSKKYCDEYEDRRSRGSPNHKIDASLTVGKHRESHHKGSRSEKHLSKRTHTSDDELSEGNSRRNKYHDEHKDRRPSGSPNRKNDRIDDQYRSRKSYYEPNKRECSSERQLEPRHEQRSYASSSVKPPRPESSSYAKPPRPESNSRHRNAAKLSEEERAAKLKEMEMDAQRHEEQRWKRLKKAADAEAQEAIVDQASSGRNFLDATQKSVYGAEKGGSSTIEESVRRRTHYSQRRSDSESNAFRRT